MTARWPILILALLAWDALAAAPSHAFLWFGKRERAGLLWIPSETFSDWEGLAGALRRHKKLSFTAALTPAMATVESRAGLQPLVAEGRLE
ncbi:MAG: hypothetical protein HY748_06025, partial [Elusimicrobia bacterium]|nr:hypothetical protein [Elusimicrobiota bacterium]